MSRVRLHWVGLVVFSIVLAWIFDHIGLPASRLLGPMVAAIVMAVRGLDVRVPRVTFYVAQAVTGCLIARGVPGNVLSTLSAHWPSFLAGVVAVTVLANGLGWMLARWDVFPGSTAIWGSAPGAASAMLVMSEAYGADVRLVAFMQYLRVACVSFTASVVAHWWITSSGGAMAHAQVAPSLFAPPANWEHLGWTLAVMAGGAITGVLLRIPAGALLVPMAAGIAMQDFAGVPLELPPLVLAIGYAFLGWTIGMRFNRQVLLVTARSFPQVLAAILVLIGLCGLFAAALVRWAHVDPLTAYLATSPGGADSVAIIAASSPVDVPFVVTMQVLRMLFVMLTGPAIARLLSRHIR